jgi:hypothetical protein
VRDHDGQRADGDDAGQDDERRDIEADTEAQEYSGHHAQRHKGRSAGVHALVHQLPTEPIHQRSNDLGDRAQMVACTGEQLHLGVLGASSDSVRV